MTHVRAQLCWRRALPDKERLIKRDEPSADILGARRNSDVLVTFGELLISCSTCGGGVTTARCTHRRRRHDRAAHTPEAESRPRGAHTGARVTPNPHCVRQRTTHRFYDIPHMNRVEAHLQSR